MFIDDNICFQQAEKMSNIRLHMADLRITGVARHVGLSRYMIRNTSPSKLENRLDGEANINLAQENLHKNYRQM